MLVKLQGLTDACNALIHFSSLKYTWYSTEQTVNKLQLRDNWSISFVAPSWSKADQKKSAQLQETDFLSWYSFLVSSWTDLKF